MSWESKTVSSFNRGFVKAGVDAVDPVEVTKSFLGAWAASSVDDLMRFMASDAVVVGDSGARYADEASLRQVIGRLKGLENREYEVRLDGDRVSETKDGNPESSS